MSRLKRRYGRAYFPLDFATVFLTGFFAAAALTGFLAAGVAFFTGAGLAWLCFRLRLGSTFRGGLGWCRLLHQREAGLIADGVIAPQLANGNVVFGRQAARDLNTARGDVQVKWDARPAEVGPLGHGLEMIHRLRGFNLDRSLQSPAAVRRRQHEIRKDLNRTDFDWHRLIGTNIDGHFVTPLQADLQQPDDAVMLELLAHRPDEDRTHWTSRRREAISDK